MPNNVNPAPPQILVVEEDAATAALLTTRLTPLVGARVTLVAAAAQALEAVAQRGFDLILLGASQSRRDALDLVGQMRTHAPETAVVVLSSEEDPAVATSAMQAGAQDFLTKQEVEQYPPLLERAIRYAMERQRFLMTLAQVDELRGRERQLRRLNQMGELLHACVNMTEAQQIIVRAAEAMFGSGHIRGALGQLRPEGDVELIESWGEPKAPSSLFESQKCWALRRGSLHASGGGQPTASCEHWPVEGGAGLCIPLSTQGEVLGVLSLSVAEGNAASLRELTPVATAFAEHVSLAMVNLRLRDRMQRESIHDPLTGVWNRRYLQEALERELARAQRANSPMSLLMLDVDDFKTYNDRFGHLAGDRLLAEIGAYLKAQTREADLVCRYGGDEFCLVLPGANADEARLCSEKLREGAAGLHARQRVAFSAWSGYRPMAIPHRTKARSR